MSRTLNFATYPKSDVNNVDCSDLQHFNRAVQATEELERRPVILAKTDHGKCLFTNTLRTMTCDWSHAIREPLQCDIQVRAEGLERHDEYDILVFDFVFPWSLFCFSRSLPSFESAVPFQEQQRKAPIQWLESIAV